ncbi:unnamed protein product [Triticum turgidum subsp. durum]|uniref:Uncharacterized protein n=1 Tax=Triticum turgidum subsp. durum TaxID=4567 RepID=A0A9R1BW42_TRITD|nr:unnamed protein product [Triticum turgidum subsp. durum]
MEGGEMCGKSVSEEVKPEWEEGEVLMQGEGGGGGDGGAATAAGEAMAPVQIDVRMDVALLHCQACLLPLKPPVFKCEAAGHVRPAGDDKDNLVLMNSAVSSSALSTGAPAPGQGMFLAVPQELLSGDTLMLSVRIDLIRPAGGAPKSATPQARTPRRMQ